MVGNRSLDDFLDGSGDGPEGEPSDDDGEAVADEADPAPEDEHTASEGEGPAEAIEPAISTYRVDPAGEPCERCGETVRRRWRDDGLVRSACKEW